MARLPLFPLGTVLFPGARLPLQVFEPRYIELLSDLSRQPPHERRFGVVAIRRGEEVGTERRPELESVGTAALLTSTAKGVGGPAGVIFAIDSVGEQRMRVEKVIADELPYLVGEVTWLEDAADPADEVAGAVEQARAAYAAFALAATGRPLPEDGVSSGLAPDRLAYELAQAVRLPLQDRQAVLAGRGPVERLAIVSRLLRREATLFGDMRLSPVDRHTLHPPSSN